MMTKTIIFEGGPLDNQFRVVPSHITIFEIFVPTTDIVVAMQITLVQQAISEGKDVIRKYYKKSDKLYNNIECFVYIEDKLTKNESNTESTEVNKV